MTGAMEGPLWAPTLMASRMRWWLYRSTSLWSPRSRMSRAAETFQSQSSWSFLWISTGGQAPRPPGRAFSAILNVPSINSLAPASNSVQAAASIWEGFQSRCRNFTSALEACQYTSIVFQFLFHTGLQLSQSTTARPAKSRSAVAMVTAVTAALKVHLERGALRFTERTGDRQLPSPASDVVGERVEMQLQRVGVGGPCVHEHGTRQAVSGGRQAHALFHAVPDKLAPGGGGLEHGAHVDGGEEGRALGPQPLQLLVAGHLHVGTAARGLQHELAGGHLKLLLGHFPNALWGPVPYPEWAPLFPVNDSQALGLFIAYVLQHTFWHLLQMLRETGYLGQPPIHCVTI
ncbi:hypothetical protein CRUP_028285 [Coryphaenoides rupestris]|nr:hypothetical protein CRUP_028285 [Coryphaenoides rupestris]